MGLTVCPRCGYTSEEPMDFCHECRVNLNTGYEVDSSIYEHPDDRKALAAVKKMKPLNIAVKLFLDRLGTPWINAQFLGGAVRVGPRQFPDLYRMVVKAGKILAVRELPKTYVVYSPVMNAFTLGTNEEPVMVLHSAIVDEMDEDELMMVIGHEMGHVKSNHVLYHTVLIALRQAASSFLAGPTTLLLKGLDLALLAWFRKSEYTADRAGLLVCGDLDAARRAMIKLSLGSRKLFDSLNLEEYMRQLEELDEEKIGKWSELLLDHPFGVRRVRNLEEFYDSDIYRSLKSRAESFLEGKMPPEAEAVTACPSCGTRVLPTDRFCSNCGYRLG